MIVHNITFGYDIYTRISEQIELQTFYVPIF